MKHFQLPVRDGSAAVLTAYLHDVSPEMPDRATRPAMLVLPGGGYHFCSDREAEPFALEWLRRGYNTFVLRYTVITETEPAPLYQKPLADAAAAISLIRKNAAEWGIDPHRIAALGFSAGGHLCGSLAVHWDDERLAAPDARPDAVVLSYPVVSPREAAGEGSIYVAEKLTANEPEWLTYFAIEEQVRADMPPAFIWTTFEDGLVCPRHSLLLAQAMQRAGCPCELHMFDHGVHGYGLGNAETGNQYAPADKNLASWPSLAANWLNRLFGWEE